jgi:lipopolysaccharide transport system ATP-binding protein
VENISKLYGLGAIGTGSLRREMMHWWRNTVLKKEDPYFQSTENEKNYLWALKNINFEIREGEAWGIIGQNGAGKSTLLKILSRIVKPTEGIVRGRGRVSSLLEVGTGFHNELTGRENIFISGNILGMNKREISEKFDEIVDFSGIELFLDTPVKRYSSGMYVRLAFAVAAHMQPDILIVDEVLAVGDAEFQKKCLGKMNDASSKLGRTVIFVSHNMQAINNLCTKSIWLKKGMINEIGDTRSVVGKYMGGEQKKIWKQEFHTLEEAPGTDYIKVLSVELIPHLTDQMNPIDIRTPLTVRFKFYNAGKNVNLSVDLLLFTLAGDCVFDIPSKSSTCNEGMIEAECMIPGNFLNDGAYYFSLYFVEGHSKELFYFEECLQFEVADFRENVYWYDKWWGQVRPNFPLKLKKTIPKTGS